MKCSTSHTFENWAETLRFKPRLFCQPETVDDLSKVISQAEGACVRTQGAKKSHTWSQFVFTRDTLLNLDKLEPIFEVGSLDPQTKTYPVRVQSGIRLHDLTKKLRKEKLGLQNLGSIQAQSFAGAISTGTHGTGLGIGNLATQIKSISLITGEGEKVTYTSSDKDYFNAARVGLGALGIITEVTIDCVADYDLESTTFLCKFDDMVKNLDTWSQKNTRVRLWWFVPALRKPYDVIITTMNPPGTGGIETETIKSIAGFSEPLRLDISWLAKLFAQAGRINPSGCHQLGQHTDNYTKVLTLPLLPIYHRECEYAVPAKNAAEALRRFKRVLDEGIYATTLPIEVRFVANDDILLSPAYHEGKGDGVCYIGVNTQDNANEIFQRFEPIMKELGGRPHWGKHFTLNSREIRDMYPASFKRFNYVRKELDPKGIFVNSLIQDLFE